MCPDRKQDQGSKALLRLFVAGQSHNSRLALKNLEALLSEMGAKAPQLRVTDVFQDFKAAQTERILLTPTLVISSAGHQTRVMGTLEDAGLVRQALSMASND